MNIKKMITVFGIMAMTGMSVAVSAEETHIAQFGIITDTHVTDKNDQSNVISVTAGPRYFTGGLSKIEAFSKAMNKCKADFVIELGDFSDNPSDGSLSAEKRSYAALSFLKDAEAKLSLFNGPRYHVFGNHDTDQLSKNQVLSVLKSTGIPSDKSWYSFDQNGIHCIVLDASFKSDGKSYSAGNYTWDNTSVPSEEIEWLKKDLSSTRIPTVVFTHQLLNPQNLIETGFDTQHIIKNSDEVRSLLEKSGIVVAVFSGHYHDGGYQVVNNIPYIVLQANAAYGNDVSYHKQYATVDIYQNGNKIKIAVEGNGNQKSYVATTVIK